MSRLAITAPRESAEGPFLACADHSSRTGRLERVAEGAARSNHNPFFIVGSGRSGTTLLRLILNGHSRIEIPPETWFILPLVKSLPLTQPLAPQQVEQAVDLMTVNYRWPDMGIDAGAFRAQARVLEQPHLADIIDIVYRHHLCTSGKPRLGDKTPPYIEIVPQLIALYPDAKFIHLVRDGRDVAISYIDLGWHDAGCRCYEHEFDWTRALRYRAAYRNSELDRRILDVAYEDLIRQPEATVRRICEFLGEDFEPQMLSWSERVERVPERERRIHPKLGQPLSDKAVARWHTRLSAIECFIMEACLQKDLRRWGYRLRFASAGWRPGLILAGWLFYWSGPFIAKAVPYLKRRKLITGNFYI